MSHTSILINTGLHSAIPLLWHPEKHLHTIHGFIQSRLSQDLFFFCCCRRVWDSFDPPRHEPVMTSSWYSALINEHQKILNFVAQGIGKRSKAQTALFLIWSPCKVSRIAWCSVNIRSLEPALHKGEERMTWDLVKKTGHNDALSRLPVVLYIYPFHLGSDSFDFNPCKTHHLYVLPASRRRFLRWMISKITKKTVLKLTKTPSQGQDTQC